MGRAKPLVPSPSLATRVSKEAARSLWAALAVAAAVGDYCIARPRL